VCLLRLRKSESNTMRLLKFDDQNTPSLTEDLDDDIPPVMG
jgi:hypothetical protein